MEAGACQPSRQLIERLAQTLGMPPERWPGYAHDLPLASARASVSPRPNNLPEVLTPLIGREADLGRLLALVRGGARLVTLTGAPGAGKTRLALAAAAALLPDFEHGVFFVPLAATRDPAEGAAARSRAPSTCANWARATSRARCMATSGRGAYCWYSTTSSS